MHSQRTVILITLLLGVGSLACVQAAAADGPGSLEDLYGSSQHGYEPTEIRSALSLDADNPSEQNSSNLTSFKQYNYATDITYDTPPTKYQDWNRYEIDNFTAGDKDTSRYPSSATLRDGKWIRDAHSTKFHQTDTVRARVNSSTTIHYSHPTGTVYGAIDYRLQTPASDTDGSDGKKVLRSVENSGIESVCLVHQLDQSDIRGRKNVCDDPATEWAVMGEESDTPYRPTISYKNTEKLGDHDRYTLVGIVTADVEVITKKQYTDTVCRENENGTEVCEPKNYWAVEDKDTVTDRVIVTDSWETSVYRTNAIGISETDNAGSQYDKNKSEIYFQTRERLWSGASIKNSHVTSQWRFYTRRDTGWDTIQASDELGESTVAEFSTVPIQTYAVPVAAGNQLRANTSDSRIALGKTDSTTVRSSPAPQVHPNVSISVAGEDSGNYSVTSGISVVADSAGTEDVTIHGAVPKQEASPSDMPLSFHTDRRESNLTVNVISANNTHVYLDITLRDNTTGKPIDLTDPKRDGVIILPDGRELITNSSGEATIFYNGSRSGQVIFQPAPWYGNSIAYKSSWDDFKGPLRIQSGVDIFEWIFGILIGISPILIALYYLNNLPTIESWPPWKVF